MNIYRCVYKGGSILTLQWIKKPWVQHLKRSNFCSGTYAEKFIPSFRKTCEKFAFFAHLNGKLVEISRKVATLRSLIPTYLDLSWKIT